VGEEAGAGGPAGSARSLSLENALNKTLWGSACGLEARNFGAGKGVWGCSTIECATRCKSPASCVVTTVHRASAMAATSSDCDLPAENRA
jgi:hypothetical protein